jgi:hypothetical protein
VQIAMLVVGVILLLPGVCSLFFLIGMASEVARGDPIAQAIAVLWVVCFAISAGGVALIYVARKDARVAASAPTSEGTPPP